MPGQALRILGAGGVGMVVADAAAAPAEVAVNVGDNTARLELCRSLQAAGATIATVIQSFTALSPSATAGAGSVAPAGAVPNARVHVGPAGIADTGAGVDHGCAVGDAAHRCPGATVVGCPAKEIKRVV